MLNILTITDMHLLVQLLGPLINGCRVIHLDVIEMFPYTFAGQPKFIPDNVAKQLSVFVCILFNCGSKSLNASADKSSTSMRRI